MTGSIRSETGLALWRPQILDGHFSKNSKSINVKLSALWGSKTGPHLLLTTFLPSCFEFVAYILRRRCVGCSSEWPCVSEGNVWRHLSHQRNTSDINSVYCLKTQSQSVYGIFCTALYKYTPCVCGQLIASQSICNTLMVNSGLADV